MNTTELVFFDLLYLFMNCDFDVAEEELALIQEVTDELDEETKQIVKQRRADLDEIIAKDIGAIQDKMMELGKFISELPENDSDVIDKGDDVYEMKANYLTVMMNLIHADGRVHPNEEYLFYELCKLWDMEIVLTK